MNALDLNQRTFQAPVTPENVEWVLTNFELPDALINTLTQAVSMLDKARWVIARAVADYIHESRLKLGAEWEPVVRPVILRMAAAYVGFEPSTMREYVHTAEIIPRGTEEKPRYGALCWSHYVRAARAGSWEAARGILEKLSRLDTSKSPPTIKDARRMLAESRGTPANDVEGEGESPPQEERRYWQVEVRRLLVQPAYQVTPTSSTTPVIGPPAGLYLCVLLDSVPDLAEGDTLLVCRLRGAEG